MSRNGWIKVHRKILDNPIVCKDGDHLAIWMYLLLEATHQDREKLFRGKKIVLKPGQLITGRKLISSILKVSESKIQRVLVSFEKDGQIEQQMSNHNRLISILGWSEYQSDEHQTNSQRTSNEQPVNTLQECKNVKNERMKRNNISGLVDQYTKNIELQSAITDFVDMRKTIKAPITERGLKGILTKLDKLASSDEEKIMILEQSIINSWKGVFPLKNEAEAKKYEYDEDDSL